MRDLLNRLSLRFILPGLLMLLGACSTEDFSRAGYESAKNYECNKQVGNLDCRDNYPSYEEYQRERARASE